MSSLSVSTSSVPSAPGPHRSARFSALFLPRSQSEGGKRLRAPSHAVQDAIHSLSNGKGSFSEGAGLSADGIRQISFGRERMLEPGSVGADSFAAEYDRMVALFARRYRASVSGQRTEDIGLLDRFQTETIVRSTVTRSRSVPSDREEDDEGSADVLHSNSPVGSRIKLKGSRVNFLRQESGRTDLRRTLATAEVSFFGKGNQFDLSLNPEMDEKTLKFYQDKRKYLAGQVKSKKLKKLDAEPAATIEELKSMVCRLQRQVNKEWKAEFKGQSPRTLPVQKQLDDELKKHVLDGLSDEDIKERLIKCLEIEGDTQEVESVFDRFQQAVSVGWFQPELMNLVAACLDIELENVSLSLESAPFYQLLRDDSDRLLLEVRCDEVAVKYFEWEKRASLSFYGLKSVIPLSVDKESPSSSLHIESLDLYWGSQALIAKNKS